MDKERLELNRPHHLQFIKDLDGRIRKYDYWQADYLRLNGIYWALTALLVLRPGLCPSSEAFDGLSPMKKSDIIDFIIQCQSSKGNYLPMSSIILSLGGFGGNVGHDAHLTFTLSAFQILLLLGSLNDARINMDLHLNCIHLQ